MLCISSMLPLTPAQHRAGQLGTAAGVVGIEALLDGERTIGEGVCHGQVVVQVHRRRHHDQVTDGRRLRQHDIPAQRAAS